MTRKPTPAQLRALRDAAVRDIPRKMTVRQSLTHTSFAYFWLLSDGTVLQEKTAFACERAGWLRDEGANSDGTRRLVLTDAGRLLLSP
jgi:hypothetical protein